MSASMNGDASPAARADGSRDADLPDAGIGAGDPSISAGVAGIVRAYPLGAFALAAVAGYLAARLWARR